MRDTSSVEKISVINFSATPLRCCMCDTSCAEKTSVMNEFSRRECEVLSG